MAKHLRMPKERQMGFGLVTMKRWHLCWATSLDFRTDLQMAKHLDLQMERLRRLDSDLVKRLDLPRDWHLDLPMLKDFGLD